MVAHANTEAFCDPPQQGGNRGGLPAEHEKGDHSPDVKQNDGYGGQVKRFGKRPVTPENAHSKIVLEDLCFLDWITKRRELL
jgi:hypothetical protein